MVGVGGGRSLAKRANIAVGQLQVHESAPRNDYGMIHGEKKAIVLKRK